MNYHKIPDAPELVTSANVLIRLIDGLGFRYKWATEGLTESDLNFRPCDSSKNMIELLRHINDLAYITNNVLQNQASPKRGSIENFDQLRESTLNFYIKSRNQLGTMSNEDLLASKFKTKPVEYPFWNLINGPMADALTHVGQITSWRRIAGNPIPKVNPFLGFPYE